MKKIKKIKIRSPHDDMCADPDLIPDQKLMAIPEPLPEHDGGPPLFLRPWEIIHDEVPALRYLVRIRLVEFQDWHTPPPSSDDEAPFGEGGDSDSGDSNFNGYHPGYEPDDGNGGGRRPRTTSFGGATDPRLGPGSGPACRPCGRAIQVGEVMCPEVLSTVTSPCHLFGSRIAALGQPRPCLDVLALVEAPRAPRSECTGSQKVATRGTGADLELWSPGSPSSVTSRPEPMLDESSLCTPLPRQEDSLRTPHSIEAWPCVRDSWFAGLGLVGAALDFEPELLLGRIKLTYDDSYLTNSAEADCLPRLQAVDTHLFDEYSTGGAMETDVDAVALVEEADVAAQEATHNTAVTPEVDAGSADADESDSPGGSGQPQTDLARTQPAAQSFLSHFKKPLPKSILTTPLLRVTRQSRTRDDSEVVPKRSARLAAKSGYREPKPEAQARRVMMRRLGYDTHTNKPDEASFDEFQELFALPLSPSKREAMDLLFPQRRSLAINATEA